MTSKSLNHAACHVAMNQPLDFFCYKERSENVSSKKAFSMLNTDYSTFKGDNKESSILNII
jgi:hypothetical protein